MDPEFAQGVEEDIADRVTYDILRDLYKSVGLIHLPGTGCRMSAPTTYHRDWDKVLSENCPSRGEANPLRKAESQPLHGGDVGGRIYILSRYPRWRKIGFICIAKYRRGIPLHGHRDVVVQVTPIFTAILTHHEGSKIVFEERESFKVPQCVFGFL